MTSHSKGYEKRFSVYQVNDMIESCLGEFWAFNPKDALIKGLRTLVDNTIEADEITEADYFPSDYVVIDADNLVNRKRHFFKHL